MLTQQLKVTEESKKGYNNANRHTIVTAIQP